MMKNSFPPPPHILPLSTHVIVMGLVLLVWKMIVGFPLHLMLNLSSSIDNVHATLDNKNENCISFDLNSFISLGRSNMEDSHVLNDKIVKKVESFI